MKDPAQPLAEVFGHLITDHTEKANQYRSRRLCPFNNKVPNCTKDKAKYPLGVCSIYHEDQPVITTPSPGKIEDFIRLLQEKLDEHLETPPITKTIEKPF